MSNETNVTEISVIPFGGMPMVSIRNLDGSEITGPMTPEQFTRYAADLEQLLDAGRKLLDEIKEES